jgi:hypothetical protein
MDLPIRFAEPSLEAEFWGHTSLEIQTGPESFSPVIISPSLRAIVICTAVELYRAFGVYTKITDCLRTWAQEDDIYPARVKKYGPRWQPGKPSGPHLYGRGIDWILIEHLEKAYSAGVSYQNRLFPYGWNAPSRLVRGGKIIPLKYKTAIAHNVGRGYHVHSQESWRG